MKAKIVQFKNGRYAIRKGWLFKRYADLTDLAEKESIFWWSDSEYAEHFTTLFLQGLQVMVEEYNSKKDNKKANSLEESAIIENITLK